MLAVFVAQTKGMKSYDLATSERVEESRLSWRTPENANCAAGTRSTHDGHLEAHVAAHTSPLMRDLPVARASS